MLFAGRRSQPSVVVATPSSTRRIGPVTPVVVSGLPNTAWCAPYDAAPVKTSCIGALLVHRYICIRGWLPSAGVAKFALSVPEPSWASALTESLPTPPRPKLSSWKFSAASVKPWR
jgi:hypothetical protein